MLTFLVMPPRLSNTAKKRTKNYNKYQNISNELTSQRLALQYSKHILIVNGGHLTDQEIAKSKRCTISGHFEFHGINNIVTIFSVNIGWA
jgi:hypothetical protein